ncbi:MAG: two-component system sensor histidine kinase AgrC [Clostridium sp.]|jgi:two-component system sensor histidine kinase AgrC
MLNLFLLVLYFYTYLYISYKLNNCKFQITKENLFLIVIFTTPYSYWLQLNPFNNLKLIITFILLTIIIMKTFNKNIISSLQISCFTFIIMMISELLIVVLFTDLLNISLVIIHSNKMIAFIFNISIYTAAIFIANIRIILNKVFKFKNKINFNLNGLFTISSIIVVLFNYSLLYIYSRKYLNNKILILFFILSVFYVIIALSFFYTTSISNKNAEKLKISQDEYFSLKLYSEITESLIDDISKFKHDYNNILFMLNGYIENNDYTGLKIFFSKEILPKNKYYIFPKLKKIKDSGFKGLFAAKLSKMINDNINISLEILNDINSDSIDPLDLCRTIGILLDNAHEAAKNSSEKFISISLIQDEALSIVILNSFNGNVNLNDIYKNGYSSKGNNRGIGLYTVKEILTESYPNVLLNTSIEKNTFIQDLYKS